MSLKVIAHGNRIRVKNPVDGTMTEMVNVQFAEQGRPGGDVSMSDSSAVLDAFSGGETGLNNIRVHTHPVKVEEIGKFPVGTELPGHINRGLYTQPQIQQQEGTDPRMIDGRPTYFKTWLSATKEEDVDRRLDQNTAAALYPDLFKNARAGATTVEILESRPTSSNSFPNRVNKTGGAIPQRELEHSQTEGIANKEVAAS